MDLIVGHRQQHLPRAAQLAKAGEDQPDGFHRPEIHSTNPLERLNGEIKRRAEVARVGLRLPEGRLAIFSNEPAITRLVGAILLKQNGEWAVQRARYMTLEAIVPSSDDPLVKLPTAAT